MKRILAASVIAAVTLLAAPSRVSAHHTTITCVDQATATWSIVNSQNMTMTYTTNQGHSGSIGRQGTAYVVYEGTSLSVTGVWRNGHTRTNTGQGNCVPPTTTTTVAPTTTTTTTTTTTEAPPSTTTVPSTTSTTTTSPATTTSTSVIPATTTTVPAPTSTSSPTTTSVPATTPSSSLPSTTAVPTTAPPPVTQPAPTTSLPPPTTDPLVVELPETGRNMDLAVYAFLMALIGYVLVRVSRKTT